MTKTNRNNGVQIPFTEQEFLDKWQEWLQYRKERRLANYVPTGLKQTFSKLLKDSGGDYKTAIQIIDQSISLSWQGLFPLKQNNNGTAVITANSGSNTQTPGGTSSNRIRTLKNF